MTDEPSKPWFIAANWTPYVFKPTPQPMPLEAVPVYHPAPKVNGHSYLPKTDAQPVVGSSAAEGAPLDLPPPNPPLAVPGFVGELIDLCWNSANSQIAEVAVASALATMSVLCSRSYCYGTLGLNLYLLVLAKTSIGKSFGYKSNNNWKAAVDRELSLVRPPHAVTAKERQKVLKNMIKGQIGSGAGLAQQMPSSPATMFHLDEFVNTIKEMSSPRCGPTTAQIKDELLRLTEMCGPGNIYYAKTYSKRSGVPEEINVVSPALTILATGTPGVFYDDLGEQLLEGGFIPRFTILDYEGGLPQPNYAPNNTINQKLVDFLYFLFTNQCNKGDLIDAGMDDAFQQVKASDAGKARLTWFDNVCMRKQGEAIEANQPHAGLWARGKEHVKQIAALIAIGCNHILPTIEAEHVDCAIAIVRPNLDKLTSMVINSQIGMSDDRRAADVRKIMAQMYIGGYARYRHLNGIKAELLDVHRVIQINTIKNYCTRLASFRNHPIGSARAFEDTMIMLKRYKEVKEIVVPGFEHIPCVELNLDAFSRLLMTVKV